MFQGWVVVIATLLYIGFLFAVATYGDRSRSHIRPGFGRPNIYALSLAVYCTSWTFSGSVGFVTTDGLDFLTIYLGPILLFTVGYPLLRRIVQLAKAERISSIADFIGARYGKNQWVAATATIIAVVGALPYIALQLKAVANSVTAMLQSLQLHKALNSAAEHESISTLLSSPVPIADDIALYVALAMAAFAILFGTRHVDATEHQEGLVLAIAVESVIKIISFLAVGMFVTFILFDGFDDLITQARQTRAYETVMDDPVGSNWFVMILLSASAALFLPRQFHVTVVENHSETELKRARWLFPLYLIVINIFVVPIALAGLIQFDGSVDGDAFVLALPMEAGAEWVTFLAFIGGLSAATAMVIVATVALAIMVSNDIVVPLYLHLRYRQNNKHADRQMGNMLLNIRRVSMFVIILLAYVFYRALATSGGLANMGLLSFAAIAQFLPAVLGGLVWRGATANGAMAGMVLGFMVWGYTLLLPAFAVSGAVDQSIVDQGLFGFTVLRPQALFGLELDSLSHGVFWSLLTNILAYILVSLLRAPEAMERMQAAIFVPRDFRATPALRSWNTSVSVGEVQMTVSRYLGEERAHRSFKTFARNHGITLDPALKAEPNFLQHAEQLLARAIGAASSRLVLSLLIKRSESTPKSALKLLDDASEAIQHNRDLLQTALNQVQQGLAVFDRELLLTSWNKQFRELLYLPADYGQVGTPLSGILLFLAKKGELGEGSHNNIVAERIDMLTRGTGSHQVRFLISKVVQEWRSSDMPDGGIVVTLTDITESVEAAEALERANETLEKRVEERTRELTHLNTALKDATRQAEDANMSKTRFLAAAGHDILQPLNAARLFTTSLVDRIDNEAGDTRKIVGNIDASLEAVEDILDAVLAMSRLDTGALKPELSSFPIGDLLNRLAADFEPIARERRIELCFIYSGLHVHSDKRLLRRVLQNLISNAIKYTRKGRVIVGCKRRGEMIDLCVIDTGIGIPEDKFEAVFGEFQRLEQGARIASGLGLGLSIVQRISKVLEHPLNYSSVSGGGTAFALRVPRAIATEQTTKLEVSPGISLDPVFELTIICIDNEQSILEGMQTLLKGWGCSVITATTISEAMDIIWTTRITPDALLLDYHLDLSNGIQGAGIIRKRFDIDFPAALITADRSPEVRTDAKLENIELLNKPLKPAQLRALLSQWATRKRGLIKKAAE